MSITNIIHSIVLHCFCYINNFPLITKIGSAAFDTAPCIPSLYVLKVMHCHVGIIHVFSILDNDTMAGLYPIPLLYDNTI